MRIKNIKIQDFRRFKSLEISDIPNTAKLIVLTGPNGSGKSALFDAFHYFRQRGNYFDPEYHQRMTPEGRSTEPNPGNSLFKKIQIAFYDRDNPRGDGSQLHKMFYIRSNYRYDPDFTSQGIKRQGDILHDTPPHMKLIDTEQRVSKNYERLAANAVEKLFNDQNSENKIVKDLRNELIGEVRTAMSKVFNNDLQLQGVGNPSIGGTFRFKKGTSDNFHYKNLSGGEKAAFDLLLDFIVRRSVFNDTVYCIDEPELHMHTELQAKLLEVIFNLLPKNCQLWISTHSIGMSRKAAELYETNPSEVTFIDFHKQDFDQPVKLQPALPNRQFWQNIFHTALGELADLVMPKYVVFCEGKKMGEPQNGKPSFDASVYKIIFAHQYPDIEFISLGGRESVQQNGKLIASIIAQLARSVLSWRVIDRDDHSDTQILELEKEGTYALSKRSIENYLWDNEVLEALCTQHNNPAALQNILQTRQKLLPPTGKPIDDIKAISNQLYQTCKRALNLSQAGNDPCAFALENLAPLIQPGMKIYGELEGRVLAPLKK